jgi:peptidoglycan hydrolase CwlO-like protein
MATTLNQDLQASITQNKDSINQVTFEIASANSCIEKLETHIQQQFDAMEAKFIRQFSTL